MASQSRLHDDSSSFPNPAGLLVPNRDHNTLSIVSSNVSDYLPEERGAGGGGRGALRDGFGSTTQGMTGPAGEPGLPPSRPSTATTAQTGNTSRKAPGSSAAGSRPPSSYSRTHVPSLTTSAFFRPMSSQRLQAQRGQRLPPSNAVISPRSVPEDDDQEESREDPGVGRGARLAVHERPLSRGTDITDLPDRATSTNTPDGGQTMQSRGDSDVPLSGVGRTSPPRNRPANLDLSRSFQKSNPNLAQRSPTSFRSSFRNSMTMRSLGHAKLESGPPTPRSAQQEQLKATVRQEMGKNYEYFTGNTLFFGGGRFQNAKERPINIGTCLAMVTPVLLFFIFSAKYLSDHVSPAIPIFFAYLFAICLSSFLHASFMDPGILPRNLHPFPPTHPNEDPLRLGPPMTEWTMVVSAASANAAMEVPTKYCKTCDIWRPPRTHHCRTCDNCVETQDHHCVWLNNCVGRRNYRQFFTFVSSGSLLAIFLFGASLGHILVYKSREKVSFIDAVRRTNGVPFAMFIYGILILIYPLSLMGYHLFLIGRGETTREYLQSHKFLKKDRHKPFTQGNVFRNWVAVLLRPRPPTYLQFKKKYVDGDQRFSETKSGGVEMHSMDKKIAR